MSTQPCPHCNDIALVWFRSFRAWIGAVDALGVAYDSQLAHAMVGAESSHMFWLCTNCSQGGMAIANGATLKFLRTAEDGPATMVTTTVTVRGTNHLVAAHTAAHAREKCPEYRKAFDMISPDIVAMREESGQDKEGGDDAVFEALAKQATDNWRDTARMTLAQATIGDLPAALRVAACFTHAFADVLWEELGESADDECGADDQARLDLIVAMWADLNGGRANKPVSRKAKQKAEAKLRAASNRRRN